jgi:hypothetical protein
MAGTTGNAIDQQLEDLYGKLGLRRYTDNDQRLCLRVNGSCDPNPACLVLQDLITSSQDTFRGRKNTKALIMEAPPLLNKAMAFVKRYGVSLPSIQNSDSQESCVFCILMLEGEKARTRQG